MVLPRLTAVVSKQKLTVSVKVISEGVNLSIGQRNKTINKLLIGKWLSIGMIIAPIEQVAPCKLISVIFE